MDLTRAFTTFANAVARVAGRPLAFVLCMLGIVVWGVSGPIFGFSDTWQLVINTSTTIITFLMVFLIQNTQNRDNAALQAKLDELIRVTNAKNGFIGIERLTDRELEQILADFEDEDTGTALGQKSAIIHQKAQQVRARDARRKVKAGAKAPAAKSRRRPAASKRA
jgi:low affinity Fe/Cu permease